MALEDVVKTDKEYAGKGVGGAALGLGIAGTALGVLNGGLGGILGGAGGANGNYVDKDMFYQTLIGTNEKQSETSLALSNRLAGIEAAIAVNATANEYQNSISALRADYEARNMQLAMDLAICNATKNVVRGTNVIMPGQIGDTFSGTSRVLDSHSTYPDHRDQRNHCGIRTNCVF